MACNKGMNEDLL